MCGSLRRRNCLYSKLTGSRALQAGSLQYSETKRQFGWWDGQVYTQPLLHGKSFPITPLGS